MKGLVFLQTCFHINFVNAIICIGCEQGATLIKFHAKWPATNFLLEILAGLAEFNDWRHVLLTSELHNFSRLQRSVELAIEGSKCFWTMDIIFVPKLHL